MANILICDDEADILAALRIYLEAENHQVFSAVNGIEALAQMDQNEVHLVLIDIMMPVMDGIRAMTKIREKSNVPLIFLTAKSEETDKVLGLNIGADDYITKPFNPVELLARVRSALRRYMILGGNNISESIIRIGGLEINDDQKSLSVDGQPVVLTPIEYGIIWQLMQKPGKVFSSRDLYRQVWKECPIGAESTVAVHIRHLREKIEINPAEPRYLKVVWGQGYKLDGSPDRSPDRTQGGIS
jgi:DNA-binding response OmpR family regulator